MRHLVIAVLLSFFGLISCTSDNSSPSNAPSLVIEKVIQKYPSGEVKAVEEYQIVEEKQKLVGYIEYHISGKVRISGPLNEHKQREGLWESFYENGNKWSIGDYNNGIENGEKKVWYENGNLRYQGEMQNGNPKGEWEFFDESGNKTTKLYP